MSSPIEINMNREVVLPLLEFIEPVLKTLGHETAFSIPVVEDDDELAEIWRDGLLHTQADDCRTLMGLFDDRFRRSGTVRIELDQADRILRASSAIRLKIRETSLVHLTDSALEEADFDPAGLSDPDRAGMAAYLLFATLQELIIRHLDGG